MVERWLGEVLYSIVDAMPTRTQLKQFGCRSSDGFDPMCLTYQYLEYGRQSGVVPPHYGDPMMGLTKPFGRPKSLYADSLILTKTKTHPFCLSAAVNLLMTRIISS